MTPLKESPHGEIMNRIQSCESDLELRLTPTECRVSVIRRFVEQMYGKVLKSPDLVSRMAMVVHELLENAARYGGDDSTRLAITVMNDSGDDRVCVELQNKASADRIADLRRRFDEMNAATNPFEYYQMVMRKSIEDPKSVGGLGLARIYAEGEMQLSLAVEGEQVVVHACSKLEVA